MSAYFAGVRPNLFAGAKPAPAKPVKPTAKPIQVRAHTRAAPAKKAKTTAPAPATPSVRPGEASTEKRFTPNFPGEPVAGRVGALKNLDNTWAKPGAKAQPGAYLAERPYYTNTATLRARAGPSGQESTQWNAAQVAAAKKMQVQNLGRPGYIARSLIPGGLNETPSSVGQGLLRGAEAASTVLPGGGVGEAAGVLGFGLKALRGLRAGKDVAEAAPAVVRATKIAPPLATDTEATKRWQRYLNLANRDTPIGPTEHAEMTSLAEEFTRPLTPAEHAAEVARLGTKKAPGVPKPAPIVPKPARVAPAQTRRPPAPLAGAPEEAAVVRSALPGAKILRGKQEAGYSVERTKRVAAARVHLDNPNLAPAERVRLAKRELAGELPKINYKGFSELNDQSIQTLQTDILNHPNLMPFQKIRASDALTNALAGKVPTRSEITLLEHVFGKDTVAGLGAFAKHPFRDTLANVLNIPRSLMASFDLSAPFRQGLMVATRHPKIFAQNFGPMIKSFGNEAVYHGMIDEIRARPTYPLMEEAKLPLTELGGDVGGREERFASSYAETLTGGKYSPVRASGRAYTGFLDKTRADVFDHLIAKAQGQGVNVQDQEFLRSLGRYVGSATGRGDLGSFQGAATTLNAVLFSPRLLASRLNFLSPRYYYKLHPFARKEALRSALQLAGTASTLVGLASQVPGVKVETDPRNPDWGKIRLGNTRIDIGGGFQQPLRLLAQLATGVAISSTTGKSLSLTTGGYGKPTRLDIAQRFFMGKESPIASLVTDWARGSTQIGQPFSWQSAAAQRLTPLLGQDALDIYKEQHGGMNGLMAAFAGYGIGSVGIGVQTYGPPAPKPSRGAPTGYFGGTSSGGGSPYFSSPSSSGGSGYFGK